MAIHPVMLYLGYVGFTVPFGFAVAALVTGRLGEGWLVTNPSMDLIAWGSLTVGILLELGGPTRCWVGAATGLGIRSKMRRCFRG